mgnify:FL=1
MERLSNRGLLTVVITSLAMSAIVAQLVGHVIDILFVM